MDLNEIWHEYESLYEVYRKCRFLKNSLPVRGYRRFTLKNIDFCPGVFSETARAFRDCRSVDCLLNRCSFVRRRDFRSFQEVIEKIENFKLSLSN